MSPIIFCQFGIMRISADFSSQKYYRNPLVEVRCGCNVQIIASIFVTHTNYGRVGVASHVVTPSSFAYLSNYVSVYKIQSLPKTFFFLCWTVNSAALSQTAWRSDVYYMVPYVIKQWTRKIKFMKWKIILYVLRQTLKKLWCSFLFERCQKPGRKYFRFLYVLYVFLCLYVCVLSRNRIY